MRQAFSPSSAAGKPQLLTYGTGQPPFFFLVLCWQDPVDLIDLIDYADANLFTKVDKVSGKNVTVRTVR